MQSGQDTNGSTPRGAYHNAPHTGGQLQGRCCHKTTTDKTHRKKQPMTTENPNNNITASNDNALAQQLVSEDAFLWRQRQESRDERLARAIAFRELEQRRQRNASMVQNDEAVARELAARLEQEEAQEQRRLEQEEQDRYLAERLHRDFLSQARAALRAIREGESAIARCACCQSRLRVNKDTASLYCPINACQSALQQ